MLEPEDILVSRLRRMDVDEVARYIVTHRDVDDDQFQLDTGWTTVEAILAVISDLSRKLDLNI